MSKNEEDASKNNEISSSKKKKINLNIIEINKNENSKDNSKEENSYSISGQNMNKNYDVTNNSDFLNDSLNSDDMKIENPNNTFHKEKGLNLSKISN
jgi:hypothetical protein